MPKVGDKEFPYTPEGIAAAKAESQNMEIPMSNGAERSSVDYAGGGNTGFAGIGKPLDVMQGVGNVGITPPEGIKPLGEQGGNQPMGYNPIDRTKLEHDVLQASEVYYEKGGKVDDMIHTPIVRDESKYKVPKIEKKHKVDTGKYASSKDKTPSDAGVKDYWKSKRKDTSSKYKVPKIEKKYKVDTGKYASSKDSTPADAGVSDYWKKDFTKKEKPKPKKTKLAGAKKPKRPPVSEFYGFTPIRRKKKGSPKKPKRKSR